MMDWQAWIVALIFAWAVYTVYRTLIPKKGSAGCASGDCACGPAEPKKGFQLKSLFK